MVEVISPLSGNVWKVPVQVGDQVAPGDTVVVLESMKMEIPIEADQAGRVTQVVCQEGDSIGEGTVLVVLE